MKKKKEMGKTRRQEESATAANTTLATSSVNGGHGVSITKQKKSILKKNSSPIFVQSQTPYISATPSSSSPPEDSFVVARTNSDVKESPISIEEPYHHHHHHHGSHSTSKSNKSERHKQQKEHKQQQKEQHRRSENSINTSDVKTNANKSTKKGNLKSSASPSFVSSQSQIPTTAAGRSDNAVSNSEHSSFVVRPSKGSLLSTEPRKDNASTQSPNTPEQQLQRQRKQALNTKHNVGTGNTKTKAAASHGSGGGGSGGSSRAKKSSLKNNMSPSFVSSKSQIPSAAAATSSSEDSFVVARTMTTTMTTANERGPISPKPQQGPSSPFPNETEKQQKRQPEIQKDYNVDMGRTATIVGDIAGVGGTGGVDSSADGSPSSGCGFPTEKKKKKSNLKSNNSPSFVSSQSQIPSSAAAALSSEKTFVVNPTKGSLTSSTEMKDGPSTPLNKPEQQKPQQEKTVETATTHNVEDVRRASRTTDVGTGGGILATKKKSNMKSNASPSFVSSQSQIPSSASTALSSEKSFVVNPTKGNLISSSEMQGGPLTPTPNKPEQRQQHLNSMETTQNMDAKKTVATDAASGGGVPAKRKKSNLKSNASPSFVSSQSQIPSAASVASSKESYVVNPTKGSLISSSELSQEGPASSSPNKSEQLQQQRKTPETIHSADATSSDATDSAPAGGVPAKKKKSSLKNNTSPSFVSSQSQIPSAAAETSSKESFVVKPTKGSLISSEMQGVLSMSLPNKSEQQHKQSIDPEENTDTLKTNKDGGCGSAQKTKKRSILKSDASPSFVSSQSQIPSTAASSSEDSFVIKSSKGYLVSGANSLLSVAPSSVPQHQQQGHDTSYDSKANAAASSGIGDGSSVKKSILKNISSPSFVSSQSQVPSTSSSTSAGDSFVVRTSQQILMSSSEQQEGGPARPTPNKPEQQKNPQQQRPQQPENSWSAVEEQEVDFFANPTLLSRLILNKEFLSALKRLRNFPKEAAIWVTVRTPGARKRRRPLQRSDSWPSDKGDFVDGLASQGWQRQKQNDSNISTIRTLPLHMACQFLKSSDPPKVTKELEKLMIELAEAYPRACSVSDQFGRYPLHEAVRWEASVDAITAMMMAAPEMLFQRDRNNALPTDIRADNESVKKVLNNGLRIWQESQIEAKLRFQLGFGHASLTTKEATVRAVNGLVGVRQTVTMERGDGVMNDGDDESNVQLERSSTLIAELYERNNKLGGMVNRMKKETRHLKIMLSEARLPHDLEDLYSDERKKATRQEIILRDNGFDNEGDRTGKAIEPEEEGISMMSMDPEPPTVLTKYLEYKVGELQAANELLEIENERLQVLTEELNLRITKDDKINSHRNGILDEEGPRAPATEINDEAATLSDRELQSILAALNTNLFLSKEIEDVREQLAEAKEENCRLKNSDYFDVEQDIEDDTEYDVEETERNVDDGTINTDVIYDQQSPKKLPGTLEDRLKDIDRRSGSGAGSLVGAVMSTPSKSRRSLSSRAESKVSLSSWGLLSFTQQNSSPRKLLKSKKWAKKTPVETLHPVHGSAETFQTEAFHDSLKSSAPTIGNDDLSSLFRSVADFTYEAEKQQTPKFARLKTRGKTSRRYSDGGVTPTLEAMKNKLDTLSTSQVAAEPFVETAQLLATDEEITELVKDAEAKMRAEIPLELVMALREVCLHTASESLRSQSGHSDTTFHVWQSVAESLVDHKLIDEAQKLYGKAIPYEVVSSLRAASALRLEKSREDVAAMETMKNRLDQELLDALIDTAECQMDKPISQNIVDCLRETGTSFGSLLSETCDDFDMIQSISIDFQALDKMVKAAQEIHGSPFPHKILVAIRHASFVLQSRLEGTELSPCARGGRTAADLPDILPHGSEDLPNASVTGSTMAPSSEDLAPRVKTVMSSDEYVLPIKGFEEADGGETSEFTRSNRQGEMGNGATGSIPAGCNKLSTSEKPDGEIPTRRWSDFVTPVRIEHINFDSSGRSYASYESQGSSPRRRRSFEGGDDPGFMYRQARARSRSPTSGSTNDLDAIYDRAFRARSRSPVSEAREQDDLEHLYRRASIQRNHSNNRLSGGQGNDVTKTQENEPADSSADPSYPIDADREPASVKNPEEETKDVRCNEENASTDVDGSTTTLDEVDAVIEAAKKILGRDISEELVAALRLVSQSSMDRQDEGGNSQDLEVEYDYTEEDTNYEESDIRSQAFSMSITSEGSMDIAAVFQKDQPGKPPKQLKKLEPEEKASSKQNAQQAVHAEVIRKGTSPVRGVRKAFSGDLDAFLAKSKGNPRIETVRRSKSMELDVPKVPASPFASAHGEALLGLAERVGTDDLDALYKHAKEKVAEGSTLLASTHHMPNKNGNAAFDTVITDTEETYGIEVPSTVVDALKRAVLGSTPDVPILSIVRSLHDDRVIATAESYLDGPIPSDLLHAIRASSLPPGVSIDAIIPIEETGSASESGSADQSKKSSRGSLSFFEASAGSSGEIESIDPQELATPPPPPPPPPPKSTFESHYGAFAAVSQEDLDKSQEELDAELVKVKSKSATGQVSGGARPSRIRRPRKSDDNDSMDNSNHSATSWSQLSLSKSPAVTKKKSWKPSKATKKHQKGTKAAKFEQAKSGRAQKKRDKVNQFMNSLADFGGDTDDLREIYNQAKDTLQSYSPNTERKMPVGSPARPFWGDKKGKISELNKAEEAHKPSPSMQDLSQQGFKMTNVPRPQLPESCIEVSPQELELDMLFDAAQRELGCPLPVEVDIALRKASRSMDESLDFIAPANQQLSQRNFGSHLPLQRLEILFQEAEVFIGGELPHEALTAMKRAASKLRTGETGTSKTDSSKSILSTEGRGTQESLAKDNPDREYRSQREPRQRVKSESELPEDNGTARESRMDRHNNSAPLPNLSLHSFDSLQSVAEGRGNEDDLMELYKAAYAESPRTKASSTESQKPMAGAKSMRRVEEFVAESSHFFSPKIASFEGTRKRNSSPVVMAAATPAAAASSGHGGWLPEPASPPKDQFSPPVPSFNSKPKNRNVPVSEISAGSLSNFLERTDSGKWLGNVSPITAASMGTEGDASKVDLKSAVARLKALSESLPDLIVDEVGYPEETVDGDSAVEETRRSHASRQPSSASPASDELDAIIAEAQRQYGMELPGELVDALRKASVSTHTFRTVATEGGMDSNHDSYLSSLLMSKLDLGSEDGTRDEIMQRDLILNIARKESLQSEVTQFTSAHAARLSPPTFFKDLVEAAELELGNPISPEIFQVLRGAFLRKTDQSPLSRVELKLRLDSALEHLGESNSPSIHRAFEVGFERITTSFAELDSKRTRLTAGNASGYFSAVSEGEEVSVLFNEFEEEEGDLEEIFEEIKNVNGSIPRELAERLKPAPSDNDGSIDLDGLDFQYSGSTLTTNRNSASTLAYSGSLAYSASTMEGGSTLAYSVSTMGTSSPSKDRQLLKETLMKNARDDHLFDQFIVEASREYGGDFPSEVKATLRSLAESGMNVHGNFDAEEVSSQARQEFGVNLSDEVIGALDKTSRKSKFSLDQARQISTLSMISALSDSGSMGESFNSSVDLSYISEGVDENGVDRNGTKETETKSSKEQPPLDVPQPPPPAPPPPPPPPPLPETSSAASNGKPNISIGPNLLKEVKKVYTKKLPLELSYVLSKSQALPLAMNTDEDIDIILRECEDMTGKRLPADLVLSLREASVNIRTPSNSSRSRRSRFVRQASGSCRSVSRSSGMPSIQEWTTTSSEAEDAEGLQGRQVEVDRVPTSMNSDRVPGTPNWSTSLETEGTMETRKVEVDRVPAPRNMQSIPAEIVARDGRSKSSLPSREPLQDLTKPDVRYESMKSLGSSLSGGDKSIQVESLKEPDERPQKPDSANNASGCSMGSFAGLKNSTHSHPVNSNNQSSGFNHSTDTQMHSNTSTGPAWRPDKNLEMLASSSMDSSMHDSENSEDSRHREDLRLYNSSQHSTGSSTSTEVTSNNTMHSAISAASTLTSRRLPIGVNPSPPLPDVESDDLSFIFKEAAKRF